MIPIWIIYIFSIKSHYSYLNTFTILPPIVFIYRLTIVSFYKHIYKNIFGLPIISPIKGLYIFVFLVYLLKEHQK